MRIETKRLIITDFTMDMAQDVHQNSLDEDNRRFVPDEVFETVEDAAAAIRYLISQYDGKNGPYVYPVLTKNKGENIGYVQIARLNKESWEIGYHIAKKHTGNGYAKEAVEAFLPVITRTIGINEVYGICLAENAASKHVLLKCGFKPVFEGIDYYQGKRKVIFRSIRRISLKNDSNKLYTEEEKRIITHVTEDR